jgi:hypothetical protein
MPPKLSPYLTEVVSNELTKCPIQNITIVVGITFNYANFEAKVTIKTFKLFERTFSLKLIMEPFMLFSNTLLVGTNFFNTLKMPKLLNEMASYDKQEYFYTFP